MFEHLPGRLAGLDYVGEMQHRQRRHSGAGNQVELGLGHQAQSPFGSNHHAGHVERVVAEELV